MPAFHFPSRLDARLSPYPSHRQERSHYIDRSGERTNVQLNHGIITHRASVNGNTEIEATLVPGQTASVWWNTREVVAPAVPREVRFLSDVKSLISVAESDLQVAALVDLNVLQGEADQFSVLFRRF